MSKTAPANSTSEAINDFLKMSVAKSKIKDHENQIHRKKERNVQTMLEEKGLKDLTTPVVF